jgi:hypothetical protein
MGMITLAKEYNEDSRRKSIESTYRVLIIEAIISNS